MVAKISDAERKFDKLGVGCITGSTHWIDLQRIDQFCGGSVVCVEHFVVQP